MVNNHQISAWAALTVIATLPREPREPREDEAPRQIEAPRQAEAPENNRSLMPPPHFPTSRKRSYSLGDVQAPKRQSPRKTSSERKAPSASSGEQELTLSQPGGCTSESIALRQTRANGPLPIAASSQPNGVDTHGQAVDLINTMTISTAQRTPEQLGMVPARPLTPKLRSLIHELRAGNKGKRIPSEARMSEIVEKADEHSEDATFKFSMFAHPDDRDKLGATPSFDAVFDLVDEATRSHFLKRQVDVWKMAVHFPLLKMALGSTTKEAHPLVGFEPTGHSEDYRTWLPDKTFLQDMAFCMYVNPEKDKVAFAAIKKLKSEQPTGVINPTSTYAVRDWPIVMSFAVRKQGADEQNAAGWQLMTWYKNHWRLLERFVEQNGGNFDEMPFLPVVMINDHKWSFAASIPRDDGLALWRRQDIGSTDSVLGVYKLVFGLQRLAKWAGEVYWPWFRKNALGLSESEQAEYEQVESAF